MNHLTDSAAQRSVVALVTAFCFLASAVAPVLGQSDAAALPTADFVVAMPPGQLAGEFPIRTDQAGRVTVLIRGLSGGGEVRAERNGQAADRVELLATGGLKQGRADAALVTLEYPAGESRVRVAESPGVQMVRAAGTNLWFGTHSEAGGKPLFSVDLDQLQKNDVEYPVVAFYGGEGRPFCWFSGKFDRYYGESYTSTLTDVAGQSGTGRGTLRYTAGHPARNLVMPTAITLEPEFGGAAFTLRLQQTLRATGTPTWGDNLEFLHLVINPQYGHDWEDGAPDYVWYRTQREDAPDTA